jgi:cytochrome c oxidase subunit I
MTLTASPGTSTAIDNVAFGDVAAVPETWFTTTDHRKVGGMMTGLALLVGIEALALMTLVGTKIDAVTRNALSTDGFLGADANSLLAFDRFFNAQRHALPIFVVGPLFMALATLAVPRLIGATRMAFPRLQAFVLWTYLLAIAMFTAGFLVGDGPSELSLFGPNIPTNPINHATGLLIGAFAVLTVAMVLSAVNVITTVLTLRKTGLRLGAVSPFAWASVVFSAVTLLSGPVHLAGLLLTFIDRHFNGALGGSLGYDRVFTHSLFFFGRPDALVLLVPALGVASQIVCHRIGKPLIGGFAANALLSAAGIATLTAWATHENAFLQAMTQPTPNLLTGIIAIPAGLLVLVWLGSLAGGVKPDPSLLFVVVAIVLGGLAAINVIVAAARGVDDGLLPAIWSIGQSTVLTVALPLVLALGGLLDFAPVIWQRKANKALSGLVGLAGLGGGLLILVGLAGISYKSAAANNASFLSFVVAIGSVLLLGAVALTALNLLGSIAGRKGELVDASPEATTEVAA